MGIPRIGNLGGVNHGIWRSEFEGKSIGIPMGIPRIGNLGGCNYGIWGWEFQGKSIGIAMGIPRIGNLGGRITVSDGDQLGENL